MAPHDRYDFRNNPADTARRISLEAGFSEHRIGNFKKAFGEQNVSETFDGHWIESVVLAGKRTPSVRDSFFRISPLPNLAVSLHSAREKVRRVLIPENSTGLVVLREKMVRYAEMTNKQVSGAYCLFEGVNDSEEDARALAAHRAGEPV